MHRMRVARPGSCACTRPSGASRDLCRQHRRRSQCTATTSPEYPQRGPGSGPQPRVSCYSSLCTAHRGVSTCLRGSGTTARSSSRPAEEDAREAISESAPTSTTHVSQNEGSETSSWKSRCSRVRRDLGLTNEKYCSGSTDSNTYSMTVATANVRTLHPKEETESRSRFGGTLMVGKVELLEIAMRDAELDVIGLQESRSRQGRNFQRPVVSQILWRSRRQRQCWMPAMDSSVVEFHDADDGRHFSETPGGHWASSGRLNPPEFCGYTVAC